MIYRFGGIFLKSKMLHTCVRVMNLEKSLKFYEEALGLKEKERKDFPEGKFTLVYLGNELADHELELTYNYDQEQPYDIGNGYGHIAVAVEDLEASREKHIEMGIETTKLMGLPGTKASYYFITDPDGYKIEVMRAK